MVRHDVPELRGVRPSSPGLTTTKHQIVSPFSGCGHADRGRLRDRRVRGERALHLRRPQPLAGDRQRVVGPTVEEPEPVLVARRPVAVDPDAREATPVGLEVPLRVAPDPPRHRGPRLAADELPHLTGSDRRPVGSTMSTSMPSAGPRRVHGLSSQIGSGERKQAPPPCPRSG